MAKIIVTKSSPGVSLFSTSAGMVTLAQGDNEVDALAWGELVDKLPALLDRDDLDAVEIESDDIDAHESVNEDQIDLEEMTVREVDDYVSGIEDIEELDYLRNAELGGKNRSGALDSINSRIDEIEDIGD